MIYYRKDRPSSKISQFFILYGRIIDIDILDFVDRSRVLPDIFRYHPSSPFIIRNASRDYLVSPAAYHSLFLRPLPIPTFKKHPPEGKLGSAKRKTNHHHSLPPVPIPSPNPRNPEFPLQ